MLILLLHSIAKSVVKSVFSLHPLPVISHPKPPFFVRFGHFGGKIHLFRSFFPFTLRDFLARNLCFHQKNQFDGVFLLGVRPNFDFVRRRKEESRRFFSSNHRRSNIKTRKVLPKYKHKHEKNTRPSRKSQRTKSKSKRITRKRPSTTEQDKLFFSPSPTPFEKYKPTFSPNVPSFRDFLPCFSQNLPTPTPTPIQSYAQDTRLRVYTRLRTQRISHFCLHPSH